MIHELSYSFSDTRYCTPKRWKVPMWGLFGRLLLGSGAVFILLSGCIDIVSTQSTLPYKFCENENDVYCPVDDKCLLRKQKCNFHSDCSSGEDELLCGESCNFDYMWPYESTPCSGWSKPLASDGRPGFFNSSWERRPQKSAEQSHGFHLDDDLGPQKDDSTGAAYGQYALFLNRDHNPNTEATLVSPWFGSTGAQCQFNFSANMFGTNVGELKLFIRTEKHVHEKWDAFDAKGTMWLSHSVIIGEFQEPIQLYFEAIRGMGDRGHIALDSLHLSNCDQGRSIIRQCHLTEFMCEDKICIPIWYVCDGQRDCYDGEDEEVSRCEERQHPLLKCDFEYGSCNWTNSSNTEVQAWFRNSGATPSNDTGPSADHTTRTKIGHYMYYEASVEARQPIASQPKSAGMETNTFPPLYPRAFNEWSPYYGTCKVTFFYHMFGADVEHLKLLVVKHVDNSTEETELHTLHAHHMLRSGRNAWLRATISLPYIKERFNLKFVASKTWRYRSDIAVDDLSVSPECYGMGIIGTTTHDELTSKFAKDDKFETIIEIVNNSMRFSFKTCANTGAHGPTQHQCDAAYMHLDMKVDVLSAAGLAGVQVWTVPQTTMYSITALGARGGIGIRNPNPSMGAYASAKFNLTQGEKIYMLVGQQGESACSQNNKKKKEIGQICRQLTVDNGNNTQIIGGGGGGGGGTMVFKIDPVTNETIPLIIAGGGGGKSFQLRNNIGSKNPIRADGGLSASGPGNSSITPERGPGAGGGWRGTKMFNQSGMSLLEGGIGGAPCKQALEFGWEISGGFGGGGGACTAGGGGGGYTGGNVSSEDNPAHNGQGGSSYISPDGFNIRFEPGTNDDDGEVEIAYVLDCPCEFMCIYQNYAKKEFKCYCAPNNILADDGLSCLKPDDFKEKHKARNLPTGALIAIVLGGVVLLLSFCGCIFCIVHQVHKRRLQAVQLERLSSPDYQLNRLRSAVAASQGIINGMEYNPNYDFGGTKCTLQDLKEIPREHLTLIRALGQGAFGEVYQGLLSNSGDLPVAVKTLPALCTDQAEMDFLMEALIMSKFNHPNIVRFIGVCFEKHPRFIVLELLEGGDLKTFLRESRPKPDSPSRVTMLDLVKLALDVSKGCQYLEENHFIHRDIASRNCLLSSKGPERAAKIADFGMARDIYRADYYRKGGKAMLPVKWMPPEAFLDGIFTSKTDVWSFGILLWEVFSLGYMPYPGRGNQEVMQLVTAGGRLEPPQNCPSPVYHIMQLCWADIPDRRPNFGTIIEKLRNCLQDPEVIYSPLPVFQRPPSVERDTTIMRPRESDRTVLTVDPPAKYLEPDSPSSMDQLIGPVSPDYVQSLSKKPNLSASAESLDELLEKEDPRGKASADRTDRSRPYNFDSVFKYDMVGANSRTGGPRPRQERGAELGAVGGARASPTAEKKYPQHGAMFDIDNPMGSSFHGSSDMNDSGKSSIDNVSQSSVGSSQARSNGRGSSPHSGATGPGIARSRPSPKRNPNESSNLLPVAAKQTKKSPNTPSPSSSRSTGQAGPNKTDSPSSAWDSQEVGKGAKKRLYENTSPQYGSLAEAKKDEAHPSYSGLPSPSSSHEHHGNGSDGEGQGDSGVVIDLKNAGSRDSSLDRATNSPV